MAEVHVCHAGTCLNRGAEGVLTEIEELASAVGGQCTVHETGCLGYCSQAPNAIVVKRGSDETLHTHIDDVELAGDLSDPKWHDIRALIKGMCAWGSWRAQYYTFA